MVLPFLLLSLRMTIHVEGVKGLEAQLVSPRELTVLEESSTDGKMISDHIRDVYCGQ